MHRIKYMVHSLQFLIETITTKRLYAPKDLHLQPMRNSYRINTCRYGIATLYILRQTFKIRHPNTSDSSPLILPFRRLSH